MNADEIKTQLAERAEEFSRWLFPNGKREGGNWLVGSLAGEPGGSLSICIRGDKAGVFCDFASGEKGGDNLVELYRRAKGLEFSEAMHACAKWLGGAVTAPPTHPTRTVTSKPAWQAYRMTDAELNRCVGFAETLLKNERAIRGIAHARGWQDKTIRELALDPCLGIDGGKLVLIYPTGAKMRLKPLTPSLAEKFTGQKFDWLFGAQHSLWRGDRFLQCTETVHITEGETAAIALIDAGFDNGSTELVMAVPGANGWRDEYRHDFRGRNVVIWPDADKAGAGLCETIIRSLAGIARKIEIANAAGKAAA